MSEVESNKECEFVLGNPKIVCEKCQISFTTRSNLHKHMRRIHPEEDLKIKLGKICSICKEKVLSLPKLHAHITEKHNVSLKFTEETFYCEDDFFKWKSEIERNGQSSFIMESSYRNAQEGTKVQYYVCHRSGMPVRKREPQSKRKGCSSIKIGSTCPACIKVASQTVKGISCIKVKYQSVHVGHELGGKLRLSKEDKARIASTLNAGLSASSFLKELRENYPESHPYRQISYKELNNIKRDFKVSKTRLLQQDDLVNVGILVKKIRDSDLQSAVLVYKPVGEPLPGHPALSNDDFLLGFMNDVQEKLLEMYGGICIMVDYTDCEKFYLTILMVRDENNENFPVATFFSSKTSPEMLLPFFEAIQRRLPQLKTKSLMSDDISSFFNVWQKVFKDETQHLLCRSYVFRNLFRHVEMKASKENRKRIKNDLKSIWEEKDIDAFEFMLKSFVKRYETIEKNFITYFQTSYVLRKKKWAYCYRMTLGIDPDMRLERWRDQLKLDVKGSDCKRLDKTLCLVCNTVAKKLISKKIVMDVKNLSARMLLCQKFHEESLTMENVYYLEKEKEKKYAIAEIEDGKRLCYMIEKMMEFCECEIRCKECDICIHSMSCSCVEHSVHFAICKHMHRCCRPFTPFITAVIMPNSEESDDSLSICDDEPIHSMEVDDVNTPELRYNPQFIINDVKARVKSQLQRLEKKIEDSNNLEIIKSVEERIISIHSFLDDAVPSSNLFNKVPMTESWRNARKGSSYI